MRQNGPEEGPNQVLGLGKGILEEAVSQSSRVGFRRMEV